MLTRVSAVDVDYPTKTSALRRLQVSFLHSPICAARLWRRTWPPPCLQLLEHESMQRRSSAMET